MRSYGLSQISSVCARLVGRVSELLFSLDSNLQRLRSVPNLPSTRDHSSVSHEVSRQSSSVLHRSLPLASTKHSAPAVRSIASLPPSRQKSTASLSPLHYTSASPPVRFRQYALKLEDRNLLRRMIPDRTPTLLNPPVARRRKMSYAATRPDDRTTTSDSSPLPKIAIRQSPLPRTSE